MSIEIEPLVAELPKPARSLLVRHVRAFTGQRVGEDPKSLTAVLRQEGWVDYALDHLDEDGRKLLWRMFFYLGRNVPYWFLKERYGPRRTQEVLESWQALGLLFLHRGGYLVNPELNRRLAVGLARRFGVLREDVGEGSARGPVAVTECVRVAGMLLRRPARITQQGQLYKKDVEFLSQGLSPRDLPDDRAWQRLFAERPPGGFPSWHVPWRDYPLKLGVLLWALGVLGVLEVQEGMLSVEPSWREIFEVYANADLWLYLVRLVTATLVDVDQIVDSLVMLLVADGAVVPRRLRETLEEYGERGALFSAELLLYYLYLLGMLGALEAKEVDGEAVVRLAPLGRVALTQRGSPELRPGLEEMFELRFYVQSSGLVVAPPFLDVSLQAALEEICDIEKADVVSVYKLTPESIMRARERGWTKEGILDFLRDCAPDVPQPVEAAIETWCARYRRLRLMQVTLLECEDETTADQVAGLQKLGAHVLGRLTPRHLILRDTSVEEVRRILLRHGLRPEPGVWRPGFDRFEPEVFARTPRDAVGLHLLHLAEDFRRRREPH